MSDQHSNDRRWALPGPVSDESLVFLTTRLGLPSPFARLLLGRGLESELDVRKFLSPSLDDLHDPFLMPDMQVAVDRLERAISGGERILVHGDYDADGMSAAALLTHAIRRLGASVETFVPHRTRDGYDLSEAGLERAARIGASLIVTADCGITALDAVARAGRQGRDVIITDHHRPGPRLPSAVAAVNPMRRESEYPFPDLAGVGVAFKLMQALFDRAGISSSEANQHLDLVALGTVADQMPLHGENRILVRAGLRALAMSRKPGVRSLLTRVGALDGDAVDTEHISFRIAPRLNSVGRMGSADSGVELLMTWDQGEADRLAADLERANAERRQADQRVYAQVEEQIAKRFDPKQDRAVVVWGDDWHPGVIGIVASRIVDLTRRPAIVVSFDGEIGRGSGRSIDGFQLHAALEELSGHLERFGGHQMAAGLSIRRDRIEQFAQGLKAIAAREIAAEVGRKAIQIDAELSISEADRALLTWLGRASPFGAGNPAPIFLARSVQMTDVQAVGPERAHLRCVLVDEQHSLDAIGFGLGSAHQLAGSGGRFDVLYHFEENRWNGRTRLQARMVDFRPASG
ncbi:MAG: single-stranded-DNA-specific exonuclease RecJ [Gemmatimonadota bacterium]